MSTVGEPHTTPHHSKAQQSKAQHSTAQHSTQHGESKVNNMFPLTQKYEIFFLRKR